MTSLLTRSPASLIDNKLIMFASDADTRCLDVTPRTPHISINYVSQLNLISEKRITYVRARIRLPVQFSYKIPAIER